MKLSSILLASTLLVGSIIHSWAQQIVPAQMGLAPLDSPPGLYVLDPNNIWSKIGTFNADAFTSFGAGTDVRSFGCKANGTDQTSCIQNALNNATDCVIIPASPNGFTVNGTITVKKCMRGTVWNPSNSTSDLANTSVILCNNQTSQPCVLVNQPVVNGAPAQIENLTIEGSGAIPIDTSIGLQWKGGYNLILTNVQTVNFGACTYFGPTNAGAGPISMHSYNMMISKCHKHYVVNDGTPELYFTGGRWGGNGSVDYNSADDFVYSTKTVTGGGGSGPNSLIIDTIQINPGGTSIGCAFRWGGFIDNTGAYNANKIINSHVEVLLGTHYTGTATRGFFCYDNTVPWLPGIFVANNTIFEDGSPKIMPLFNIDPAVKTGWNDSRIVFTGNELQTGNFTYNANNSLFAFGAEFTNNWFWGNATWTAGDTSAKVKLIGNTFWNGYTINGQWNNLVLDGNSAGGLPSGGIFVDNATGNVFETNQDALFTWTPSLTFGGNSIGVTYASQTGLWSRTATGGMSAQASIILTNKGTSTGQAHIEGLPLSCAHFLGASVPVVLQNMTGLTGTVTGIQAAGTNFAYLTQQSSTDNNAQNLTDAEFTNTSTIQININCGRTQ